MTTPHHQNEEHEERAETEERGLGGEAIAAGGFGCVFQTCVKM